MSKEKKKVASKVVWVTPEAHKKIRVRSLNEGKTCSQLLEELVDKK